jgi:hypothetical protein
MTGLNVEIIVDQNDVEQVEKIPGQTERATIRMVARLLDLIEDTTLIRQYTQLAKPAKPLGSDYIRTFRLQRSSKKQITRSTLPIVGSWEAKTEYASMVIGLSSQQAPIHAGRWPMLELAIGNANKSASPIFDEEMAKEKI